MDDNLGHLTDLVNISKLLKSALNAGYIYPFFYLYLPDFPFILKSTTTIRRDCKRKNKRLKKSVNTADVQDYAIDRILSFALLFF